jgi:hypothetical protein
MARRIIAEIAPSIHPHSFSHLPPAHPVAYCGENTDRDLEARSGFKGVAFARHDGQAPFRLELALLPYQRPVLQDPDAEPAAEAVS